MLLRQVLDKCYMRLTLLQCLLERLRQQQDAKKVFALRDLLKVIEAVRETPAYYIAVLCGIGSCRVGEAMGGLK